MHEKKGRISPTLKVGPVKGKNKGSGTPLIRVLKALWTIYKLYASTKKIK